MLIRKDHTLWVSITTLFLSLISLSFLLVMGITYWKISESILESATREVQWASTIIVDRAESLMLNAKRHTQVSAGLFQDLGIISLQNKSLISYMTDVVQFEDNLSNFYIGTAQGEYIGVKNLRLTTQKNYLTNTNKALPSDAIYALRYVNFATNTDTIYYKNEALEDVGKEDLPLQNFDPRARPWYQGAEKNQALYWTDIYAFNPTGEPGITIAEPLLDANKNVVAVVASDISFIVLSKFLQNQQIGKNGKAFILNETGQVILPEIPQSLITQKLVKEAYKASLTSKSTDFSFKSEGLEYFTHIHQFSSSIPENWRIAVLVPLNDLFIDLMETQKILVLISLVILLIAAALGAFLARRISRPIAMLVQEIDKIRRLDLGSEVRVRSNIKEIILLDSAIAAMRVAIRSFSRYVPKEVVKRLIEKGEEIQLKGEKKELAIFFSDIAGFTSITEQKTPEELSILLAEYLDGMSKIILENTGVIDKYIGDGIMAFWGAPLAMQDPALKACQAALACRQYLTGLNAKRREENKPEFPSRIGINLGTVFVGNVGTSERINYTVMGDPVNTASRLQALAKNYHSVILITDTVYEKVKEHFVTRPLDEVVLRGKKETTKIYELMDPTEEALACQFRAAYQAYHDSDFAKAKELFEQIKAQYPDDFVTEYYVSKLSSM